MEAPDMPVLRGGVIDMNHTLKIGVALTVVAMAGIACSPAAVAPSSSSVAPSLVPSPSVSVSPEASPGNQLDRMTIAGSAEAGSAQHITLKLPKGWENNDMAAGRGDVGPPSGMGFRTTLVDNTFKDPCAHVERSPKIGSTVDDLVTALGEIPLATATKAVKTTVAGHEATYLELTFPASLPCSQYFLWQDAPDGDWWLNGPNQLVQVWILEVGGQRVTLSALSYPTTPPEAKAELKGMLDSIVFDATASSDPLDTSTWTTYVSQRYGFSVAHPADWTEEPADHDWALATDAAWPNSATEHFALPIENQGVGVSAWSVAVDPGASLESWIRAYCPTCEGMDQAVAATLDGHRGSLMPLDGVPQAFFPIGGRIYAIACWQPDDDPTVVKFSGSTRLLAAFISTMHLLPGGPVSPSTKP